MMIVSVIIPCYNAEKYIEECIYSVYNQSYKNIEIICVENNSTDRTLAKLHEMKSKIPQLIILEEPQKGACVARNRGLKASKGDLIQFLDADDVIAKTKFINQVEYIEQNNCDVVISDRIVKDEMMSLELERHTFQDVVTHDLEVAISKIITTGNPLYRSTLVKSIGGYNESLSSAQDWDFHIRMVLYGAKICYIPGYYFISRQVPDSLSSNWKSVSVQAAKVIDTLKDGIVQSGKLSDNILLKIQAILYESAIYTKNKSDKEHYINEIYYWLEIKNIYSISFFKRLISIFLGFKILIRLEGLKQYLFRS